MTHEPDDIDDLLAGLCTAPTEPLPAALEVRIMADAQAVADAATPPPSIWATIGALIGGWPAAAGLATAGVAGVWLGITPPDAMAGYIGTTESETVDLFGPVALFEGEF